MLIYAFWINFGALFSIRVKTNETKRFDDLTVETFNLMLKYLFNFGMLTVIWSSKLLKISERGRKSKKKDKYHKREWLNHVSRI